MQELRADTAVKVVIGPFVDVGDGFTPETGILLSTADEAEIIKHDATAVTSISGNTWAAITSADGYYNLTITAAQLDTEGMLTVVVQDDSVCLPVKAQFMVLDKAHYDAKYLPSRLAGKAQTGTLSTTSCTTDLSGYADDELIGRVVIFISGTALGQASDITDYANTNGQLTYTAITTAPANNDQFIIV